MEHNFDRANNWCFWFLPKRLDPEVKKILNGKDYEIEVGRPLVKMSSYEIPIAEGFSVMGSTEELIGASVKFKFTDGTIVPVHVSLEKEEVIRISS